MTPLLDVQDLTVSFGGLQAVRGISFALGRGETFAIVGESGSGKSALAMALTGLNRSLGATIGGRVLFEGRDLLSLPERRLRAVRGADVAMIFQDALSALNPCETVGAQIVEAIRLHERLGRGEARARAARLLAEVGLPDPAARLGLYPHEFSGGQRQRVMIAIALACAPKLLIADEPTTALDVTVQAQILSLLSSLRKRRGMGILFISHDLGVVAGITDRVGVMYAGRLVETGPAAEIYASPRHPYTAGLLASVARVDRPRAESLSAIPGGPPDPRLSIRSCAFAPRCARALSACADLPPLIGHEHAAACFNPIEGRAAA
jgi:oligopeptide/dipeptide ABC transporter ATP-binding protein